MSMGNIIADLRAEARILKCRLRPIRAPRGDVGWYRFAHGIHPVNRTSIINHLIVARGYESYLEIGVRHRAFNYDDILADETVGVDPDPDSGAEFTTTSDDFFERINARTFDIIFIDGMHQADFVARDITNALETLNPGGVIVLHDLNPPTAYTAREHEEDRIPGETDAWNGSSWKGFAKFRAEREDLEMYTVDADWGCGIIRPGQQGRYTGPWDSYEDLAANRVELLKLISVRNFLKRNPK